MTNLTDPNEVRLTGENSFIRLFDGEDGPMLTRVSPQLSRAYSHHWFNWSGRNSIPSAREMGK